MAGHGSRKYMFQVGFNQKDYAIVVFTPLHQTRNVIFATVVC